MVVHPNSQPISAGVGAPVRSYNPCCRITPGIAPPFRCKQVIVVNLATAARGSHKVDAAFSIQIKQTTEKLTENFQTTISCLPLNGGAIPSLMQQVKAFD